MVSITAALGAGSGLDTVALVDQLANAARAPREKALANAETLNSARISALGSTRAAIDQFADALASLFTAEGYAPVPASSSTAIATASLIAGARPDSGGFALTVTQLASAQSWRSATYADVNAAIGLGALTLTGADGTATIDIVPANASIGGLAAAINAAGVGVQARVLTDADGTRLILTGREGSGGGFTLTADAGASPELTTLVSGMTQTAAAADALVSVDGTPLRYASNRVDDLWPGVAVNLASLGSTRITIPEPTKGMADLLGEFVTAYNSLRSALNKATAAGSSSDSGGPLAGDARVRGVMRALAGVTTAVLGSAEGLSTLSDLGVKTLRDGTLSFDKAGFDRAYAASPDAVRRLIDPEAPSDTAPGIARMLDDVRDRLTADDGPLDTAVDGYQVIATRLRRDRERMEEADARLRALLGDQFGTMDRRLAAFNATKAYLDQQIAIWNAKDG